MIQRIWAGPYISLTPQTSPEQLSFAQQQLCDLPRSRGL